MLYAQDHIKIQICTYLRKISIFRLDKWAGG